MRSPSALLAMLIPLLGTVGIVVYASPVAIASTGNDRLDKSAMTNHNVINNFASTHMDT